MKKYLILLVMCFIAGAFVGIMLTNIFYVKKRILVTIDKNEVTLKSNANHNGDTYTITMDGDTISQGIVIDGQWE